MPPLASIAWAQVPWDPRPTPTRRPSLTAPGRGIARSDDRGGPASPSLGPHGLARPAAVHADVERVGDMVLERYEYDLPERGAVGLKERQQERSAGHLQAGGGLARRDRGRDRGDPVMDRQPLLLERRVHRPVAERRQLRGIEDRFAAPVSALDDAARAGCAHPPQTAPRR